MKVPARWGALPLIAAPLGAWALGLGEIEIQSALNQPFLAQIALETATVEELQGLSVTLASQETFERYGLDRPAFLSAFEFRVGRSDDGADIVLVSSRRPIAEPFVTMLVEATWPRGRLLREYTVLLDPPLLLPRPAAAGPVEPAETRVPQANVPDAAISRPSTVPPVPEDAPELQPDPSLPRAAQSPPPRTGADVGTSWPVQRGDTLWAIAARHRSNDISMHQMLVTLYEANRQAFGDNMNLLYAGAVLRIPELAEFDRVSASSATAEFLRQTDEWQGRTQQQARLRLVPPTQDPQAAVAGGAADSTAAGTEVSGLRDEVAALQTELSENRRLLEIRSQELSNLQAQFDPATDGAPDADAAPPTAADPGVELESEQPFADEPLAEAPDAQVSAVPGAESSLVSRALEFAANPLALIGAGAGLSLLTALLFLRRRRNAAPDFNLDQISAELDGAGTAETNRPDPETMDELGTKLDLARAYIDMGDAGSARNVLAEVLEEGDSDQREEAQTLIDALGA
ncbi:FimV/HubP family polar landmark protein [Candidatus Rariloculus sp.]|uniref:FimV/HubP family polar landmark protein n=1 Tax=Candidatus Rariloculus sp. TaxID=3101265 RepID=UPI003D13C074